MCIRDRPKDQPNTEAAGALVATVVDVGEATSGVTAGTSTSTGSTSTASTSSSVVAIVQGSETATTLAPRATQIDAAPTSDASTSSQPQTTAAAPTSSIVETTGAPEPPVALASVPIGQLALDRMSFDWRIMFPVWRVEFLGPREGLRALTYPSEKRIEIFVRSDDTPETIHRVFAHELGHVIDVELNNDADRARWVEQRNLPADAPWWPSAAAPDFATGAGDFAEAFAVMETGVVSRSSIGDQPTVDDLLLLQELMRG